MSLKIEPDVYTTLLKYGYLPAHENVASFAPVIVKLFGNQYLTWVLKEFKFSEPLKKAIIEHHYRYRQIQECLDGGKKELRGNFIDPWLQKENPLYSLEKPEEKMEGEKKRSYSVLDLPFQRTFFRNIKDKAPIKEYESIQLKGTYLLYDFLERKPVDLSEQALFALQRTLFIHSGLYDGTFVFWISLVLEWASTNERWLRLCELFKLFGNSLPHVETLAKQPKVAEPHPETFRQFIATKSIKSLEKFYPFLFPHFFVQHLQSAFKNEQVRLDCLFFAGYQKLKREQLKLPLRRSSKLLLCCFQFLKACERYEEDRSSLLELIKQTEFNLENYYVEYIPENFSDLECRLAIGWIVEQKIVTNGFYLLCFLLREARLFNIVKTLKISFYEFSSQQIIHFLSRNVEGRLERLRQAKEWKELKGIATFSSERERFLFSLAEEADFQLRVELVKKIGQLIEKELDSQEIFFFLMSKIDLKSIKEKVFVLIEELPSIQETLKLELQIAHIANGLRGICVNEDEFKFPLMFSEWLMEKFSSVDRNLLVDD